MAAAFIAACYDAFENEEVEFILRYVERLPGVAEFYIRVKSGQFWYILQHLKMSINL